MSNRSTADEYCALCGVYLKQIKIVLMVVFVEDLAEQIAVAEVMFQIEHSLLQGEVLV